MTPRLQEKYKNEVVPAVMKQFNLKNSLQVPRFKKIVVNMGVGLAAHEPKLVEEAQRDLTLITGQKAVITKAKKSISNFKIRQGSAVGCMVTLRKARMYEFLDRLVNVALPKVRDFKGISPKGFDQHGNYTFGLTEQAIFPEVDPDKISKTLGMDIIINMTRTKRDLSYAVLKLMGVPFREK